MTKRRSVVLRREGFDPLNYIMDGELRLSSGRVQEVLRAHGE